MSDTGRAHVAWSVGANSNLQTERDERCVSLQVRVIVVPLTAA
jgi:hypothetical protein